MKKLMIFLMLGFLIFGCSNDDDIDDQIIGEWKLIIQEVYGQNSEGRTELFITDFSEDNIIYNFQSNGTLKVSGGQEVGYGNAEFEYLFEQGHLVNDEGPKLFLVHIENITWIFNLDGRTMTLNNSYVDGPKLTFERN